MEPIPSNCIGLFSLQLVNALYYFTYGIPGCLSEELLIAHRYLGTAVVGDQL